MNITIVGTGYVGLISGVCFAETNNHVVCVDSNEDKIKKLNNGIMPIYEKELEDMCTRNYKEGKIEFTTDMKYAIQKAEVIIIAVGTPSLPNGDVDLSFVYDVSKLIGKYINGYKVIVNKSTVPVGTQKMVTKIISKIQQKYPFDVISNPEFLREGTAIYDTMHMDRVIIGSESKKATEIVIKLHEPFCKNILVTDPESAEMIKYAANSFLATKITFINEIANICSKVGADVKKVAEGIGMDPRISPHFLNAGIGFGGGCFPKDTRALVKIAEKNGYNFSILNSVIEANNRQKTIVIDILEEALNTIKDKTIAILGLSFKPNTNDIRESPAIEIIKAIQKKYGKVKVYDPAALEEAKKILIDVKYAVDEYDAVRDSDAVILVTEWEEFRKMDLYKVRELMKSPVFIDGRNVYDPSNMKKNGFQYYCIGAKS